ncbi:MAG: hypothetical protein ABMB14_07335, partial [Myxococcota bacterium]
PEPPPADPPDPCAISGEICVWMGLPGLAILSEDGIDRTNSGLYMPQDVAFAPDGTAYVADFNNHRVRRVAPDGLATTVAGTGIPGDGPHAGGSCLFGCQAAATDIWHPSQLLMDPADPTVFYMAAWHNHRLIRVDVASDQMTWMVGDGVPGYGANQVSYPSSIVAGPDGTLYFSDQGNQMVRRIDPGGVLADVAGQPGVGGYEGDGGLAVDAVLHGHSDWAGGPTSKLALSGSTLYVTDSMNGMIRTIDLDSGVIDRFAGRFVDGADIGSMPGYEGDGGDALDAVFGYPRDVAIGPDGEVYVADTANACVRVIAPDGVVSTFAGACGEPGLAGEEGSPLDARFDQPCGVEVDADGNVYVADSTNHLIRRITR